MNALVIDPTTPGTLYAGTYGTILGGVFKSTDGGNTWLATGLTIKNIYCLAVNPLFPGTVYAGTEGEGVYKSQDGGSTWVAKRSGLPSRASVHALAINPSTPSVLYAGTSSGGVYQSSDAGKNWTALNSGLTNLFILALAIDPALPSTLYSGTYGGGAFSFTVTAPVPVVTGMARKVDPFRIVVSGTGLQHGVQLFIGTDVAPWTEVVWKSNAKVTIGGGSALKAKVPKNTPTQFKYVNPDGQSTTTTWMWP